jgi:hypothetical protein
MGRKAPPTAGGSPQPGNGPADNGDLFGTVLFGDLPDDDEWAETDVFDRDVLVAYHEDQLPTPPRAIEPRDWTDWLEALQDAAREHQRWVMAVGVGAAALVLTVAVWSWGGS